MFNMSDEQLDVVNGVEIDTPPGSEETEVMTDIFSYHEEFSELDDDFETEANLAMRLTKDRRNLSPIKKFIPGKSYPNSADDSDEISDSDSARSMFGSHLYDSDDYLEADPEVRQLFQFITTFVPTDIDIKPRLKIFIPRFIPAPGDVDALLKVVPPRPWERGVVPKRMYTLGVEILDDPAGEQSQPALLHMQLRASRKSFSLNLAPTAIAASPKDVDKWIQEVENIHFSEPPVVGQLARGVEVDHLLQNWPEHVQTTLADEGFPSSSLECTLSVYAQAVCNLVDIPVRPPFGFKERILALHSLFTLYSSIKNESAF